jgi:heme/copper-type cytochrome/quinol oxidase subunit 2
MSLFEPTPTPVAKAAEQHPTTSATIIIFIVISAIGLAVVLGFVVFGAWYRVKKTRQQHQAAVELVELSRIEAVLQISPVRQRQDVGVAH